jgi:hypothetical protein
MRGEVDNEMVVAMRCGDGNEMVGVVPKMCMAWLDRGSPARTPKMVTMP